MNDQQISRFAEATLLNVSRFLTQPVSFFQKPAPIQTERPLSGETQDEAAKLGE